MAISKYENILFTINDRVAIVTINRPQFANALNHETLEEIADAFEYAGASDNVGAIIITGTGKHFSAGGNVKNFKTMLENGEYLSKDYVAVAGKFVREIFQTPKPTIAMINGTAAGQGAAIAAACDFRIFALSSRFTMAFINVGLSGDSGSMLYLSKLIGIGRAKELMMTGRTVCADEAFNIGLATVVAETDDQLAAKTYDFARKLAYGPSFAMGKQKALFNSVFYGEHEEYTMLECKYVEDCSKHPDFKEAVYAFCDKRAPAFRK